MAAGKKLRLLITGIQYPPAATAEEQPESIVTRQQINADYYQRGDSHYLLYEEQPEGFDEVFQTRIKRKGSVLEITRKGKTSTNMVFEAGRSVCIDYATPFGSLPLELVTRELLIEDCREKLWKDLKVSYTLNYQGEPMGEYELSIVNLEQPEQEKN